MTAFFHRLIRLQEQCAVLSRCKLRTFYSFQPTGHWAFAESINRVAATATGVFEEKREKDTDRGSIYYFGVCYPASRKLGMVHKSPIYRNGLSGYRSASAPPSDVSPLYFVPCDWNVVGQSLESRSLFSCVGSLFLPPPVPVAP